MIFVVLLPFCALFLFFFCFFLFFFLDLVVLIKFDIHQFDFVNDAEIHQSARSHYDMSTARNSLSSMSSLEVDLNDSDELAPIPEVDDALEKTTSQASEMFAMPNAKQCNSIIR